MYYHKDFIFIDDTIESIKKKIINVNSIAFEELYLFYSYKEYLSSYKIYNNITQNGKVILTKSLFIQFLININK